MNTNHKKIIRRPGGLWSVGTTGWLTALLYHIWDLARGLIPDNGQDNATGSSARTVLSIETARSSRHMQMRLGPSHPLVRLPEKDGFILPVRSVHELARECLRQRGTRHYGEKALRLPDGSTEEGAGGVPLVSFLSGLAAFPQIDALIEARVLFQVERSRIDGHLDRGESFALGSRHVQAICGNWGGGTAPGLAPLIASRVGFYCRKHGLPSEIVVIGTTPSVLSGGDMVLAQANYAAFVRQCVIGMTDFERMVFRTLDGETLRHSEPLVHRLVPFGPSSGKITVSTREEIAAQMALAAWLLLDSPYGSFADGAFRDHDKDRLDTRRFGFRGFSRLGVGVLRTDLVRNKAIADASGQMLAAGELLGINS